jgi:hypothetical protein
MLTFFSATLSSCKFGQVYTYDVRLERPTRSQNLSFENDTFSIAFTFGVDNISFQLYNKLDDAIRINWKDISASIDGDTKRVYRSIEPAIMVAPKSKITDYIQTADKITSDTGTAPVAQVVHTYPIRDNNWEPDRKYILSLKGRRIVIYLPYYVKDVYYSKTFEFVIADIQPKVQPKTNGPAS